MTIWIDPPRWPAHGRLWSHLISDSSIAELHLFARSAGIPERGFEGDHYDIPQERYAAVLALGARPTTGPEIVRMLQQSGLRLRKRTGEKGIARVLDVGFPDGSRADVDLVRSSREPPEHAVFASSIYVRDATDNWLAVWSPRRREWSSPSGWREPGEAPLETAVRETLEESGLVVDPAAIEVVGYERFHPHEGTGWGPDGRFLAVYATRVPLPAPALSHPPEEPARWVTAAAFLADAAESWWLPMARVVMERG